MPHGIARLGALMLRSNGLDIASRSGPAAAQLRLPSIPASLFCWPLSVFTLRRDLRCMAISTTVSGNPVVPRGGGNRACAWRGAWEMMRQWPGDLSCQRHFWVWWDL